MKKLFTKASFFIFFFFITVIKSYACHNPSLSIVGSPVSLGGGQYQITVRVCGGGGGNSMGLTCNTGAVADTDGFTLAVGGGGATINNSGYTSSVSSGQAGTSSASGSLMSGVLNYSSGGGNLLDVPMSAGEVCDDYGPEAQYCWNITFVTTGLPTSITLDGMEQGGCSPITITLPAPCTSPSAPTTTGGTRCGTGTVSLSAAGCSGSGATINWYANSTGSAGGASLGTGSTFTTPSISSTTTYYATCTVSGCTSPTAAAVATITTPPSAPTVTPGSVCGSGTVSLSASGCSGGTLNWYAASSGGSSLGTGGTFTTPSISTTTTYYVSCTVGSCTSTRTPVTATVNPLPVATFTQSANQCLTGNSFTFTNTGSSGGGFTHSWNFGGGGASPATSTSASPSGVTYSSAGTYTVTHTVTNTSTTCVATVTSTVTVSAPPVSNAGANVSFCSGLSASLGTTNTAGYTYAWSPITGLSSSTVSNPTVTLTNVTAANVTTNYTVTTSVGGCSSTDVVAVTVKPEPVSNAGANASFCTPGSATIGTASTAGYTYLWSPTTGLSSSTVSNPTVTLTNATASPVTTNYTVTTTLSGCTSTDVVAVTVNPIPTSNAGADVNFCSGLSAGIGTTSTGGYSYAWSPSTGLSSSTASNPTVTLTNVTASPVTTNYTVTTTVGTCTSTDVVAVTVKPIPVSNAGTDAAFCTPGSATLGTASTAGYTYAWSPATGLSSTTTSNPTATLTNATASPVTTNYTVTTTLSGCTSTDVVVVTVNPIPVSNAGADISFCSGGSGSIGTTSTAGYTYAWSPTAGLSNSTASNPTITLTNLTTSPVTTNYTVTTTVGTCTSTDIVAVTVNPIPVSNAGTDMAFCSAGNATLGTTSSAGYTYSWTPTTGLSNSAISNPTVTLTNATASPVTTNYTVTTTQGTCTSTDIVAVTVNPIPVSNAGTDAGFCSGGNAALGTAATAGYAYSWTPTTGLSSSTVSDPTITLTNVTASPVTTNYTVTTTLGTCSSTDIVAVTVNPIPVANAGSDKAFCSAASAALGTGSTSGYTYAWTPATGLSSTTVSNPTVTLTNGTAAPVTTNYTVTVTMGTCTASDIVAVTVNPLPTASATGTDISCFGGSNGTATVTPTGGGGGFTQTWSPSGGTGLTASGLGIGTYTATVTDANGCTATASYTVAQPTALTASATGTNVLCNGGTTGSVDLTVGGGTATYTYSWSNGATTEDLSAVGVGTYTVTITDAEGCITTASQSITQPAALSTSAIITDAGCTGSTTGAINLSVSGGTSGYTYSWSNGATTEDLTSLASGTFTVTVTDSKGCTVTTPYTVSQPGSLSATTTGTNINCAGTNNGTAQVTASGGTGTLTYSWSPGGSTSASLSGLAAGTYTVTVSDANSCTFTASYTVTSPTPLTANVTGTNVLCNGAATGLVDLSSGGGTTTYTYLWSNGATTEDLTNVVAGAYTVTVTDANGCTATAGTTITEPVAMVLTPSSTTANCGASNGTASVSVSGGATPYTYTWSTGSSIDNESGLSAGSYTVTVTDNNGCIQTLTISVSDNSAPTASITAFTNISCFGGSDGTATVTAAGGGGTYTYTWSPSGGNGATASGLSAGSYVVNVSDGTCNTSTSITLTEPTQVIANISSSTDATCFGASTGSATVAAAGGTPGYTYSWSPSGGSGTTASGLSANTYTVTVLDSKLCPATTTVTINQPAVLAGTITGTDVLCNGQSTGAADLTVTGGTAPYTYSWDNGATSEDISNLPVGTYTVIITDSKGCTATADITITEQTAIVLIPSAVDAACGTSNGEASVSATGGAGSYTYAWSPGGQITATITGVSAGTYNVTVTDANGCVKTSSATVNNTAAPTATISGTTDVSCAGGSDGTATVSASGGTGTLTYSWSPAGGTASTSTGVSSGTYTVTVTDALGCFATATATINQPTPLTATAAVNNQVSCNGGTDGSATVTPSGGTSGYTYSWSPGGSISATATGLSAGPYTITVTDSEGCTTTATVTITEPVALTANIIGTDVLCNGANTGAADLTVAGGTSGYTYAWGGGQTTEDLSAITAGTYNVTITDSKGCTATANVTITGPAAIVLTTTPTDPTCGAGNGQITANASGGSGGFTYTWSPVAGSSATIGSLAAGSYDITVTDANGCMMTTTATLNNAGAPSIAIATSTNVTCFGAANGTVTTTTTGGSGGNTYSWSPSGGSGPDATGLGPDTYTVTVTDNIGCVASTTVIITEPDLLVPVATTLTDVLCNGGTDGSASVSASGGTPGYTYSWSPSGGNGTIANGLGQGTYTITVTDANGCIQTATTTITEPPLLTATATSTNVLCNGESTGATDLNVTGGTGPYSYSWSNGGASEDLTGLPAGIYDVTVTDSKGCTATATTTITEPTALSLSTTTVDANCNQSDGSATVNVTGGTPNYSYSWATSGGNTDTESSLAAGTYSVFITDANGCTANTSATVNNQDGGVVSVTTFKDVSCAEVCDGFINTDLVGGTGPFTYSWSSGETTTSLSSLCGGTYDLTVTDSRGCTTSLTQTLIVGPSVDVALTATNVVCNGASSGSVSSIITGGTPSYTYSWSNGASSTNISAIGAGSYSLYVSDVNGCYDSATAVITEPTALTLALAPTDILCNGASTGAITAAVGGGISGYSYGWSPNVGSGATVSGLVAGTYFLTVTDANGCTISSSSTLSEPTAIVLTLASTPSNCTTPDGSVTTTISGGVTSYAYSWSNNAVTQNLTDVSAGSYTLTVTDANGCIETATSTVNTNQGGTASIVSTTDVSCVGSTDGVATGTITGGNPPFTYSWNDAAAQTNATAGNLAAGTYTFTVMDNKGCVATATATINSPVPLTIMTETAEDVSCFGLCDGYVSVQPTGGSNPYSYQWNDPLQQTTMGLSNVCAGTYIVAISDSKGCTISDTLVINEPSDLVATYVATPSACTIATGTAALSVSGGVPGYTYSWIGSSAVTSSASSLSAGVHNAIVTDSKGCTEDIPVIIPSLNGPVITTGNIINTLCFGSSDGSAEATVTGGISPFTYSWSNGQTTPVATNLAAGVYSVQVTDSGGCVGSATATIGEPVELSTNVNSTDPKCYNGCDGTATVNTVGGTAPYTYLWSDADFQTTQTATGLCAGGYNVIVTDDNGCISNNSTTLNNPTFVLINTSSTQVSCSTGGSCDGTATAAPFNGTFPYTYSWSDGASQITQTAMGLCVGTYTVYVSDANGCTANTTVTVTSPGGLSIVEVNHTDASCKGVCDATAEVQASGGTSPYSYSWNDPAGQLVPNASGLCAGTFIATVTDNNGCQADVSVTLNEPTLLTAGITKVDVNCYNACDGSATVSPSGGTAPYTYLWSDATFQTSAIATNLCAGSVNVNVTDANGCVVISATTITQPSILALSPGAITPSNCNQNNGSACVNVTGGSGSFTYSWINLPAQTTSCANDMYSGSYDVFVTDAMGCSASTTVNINDIQGPAVTIVAFTDVTCGGGSDGSANANITGGVSPYTLMWNDPSASASSAVNNLPAGSYSITVTDSAGCVGAATVIINQPAVLNSGIVTTTEASCVASCDGAATAAANGGTSPYTYSWNSPSPQITVTATGLCVGSYEVIVTDVVGCKDTATAIITSPSAIIATPTITDALCFGESTGIINLAVTGGSPGYTYTWSPAVGSGSLATNLPLGSYDVTITDAKGCVSSNTLQVNEPDQLIVIPSITPSTCSNSNGSAFVATTGGTSPYTYNWNPSNQTTATATNLGAGSYLVSVTDANGCKETPLITVTNIPGPTGATVTTTPALCNGSSTGSADAQPVGGTNPYSYSWNPSGQTNQTATNLAAGNYTVVVTDANQCTTSAIGNVTEPTAIVLTVAPSLTICYGETTLVYASASGGTPAYTYTWDPSTVSGSSQNVSPTATTTYSVSVSDANNCTVNMQSMTVTVSEPLAVTIDGPASLCLGSSATLTTTTTGGVTPYNYSWIPTNETTADITVQPAAATIYTYAVVVSDGCSTPAADEVVIQVNANPVVFLSGDSLEGCVPHNVNFTGLSDIGVIYSWTFGNGDSSDVLSPSYTYETDGTFDVSFTATSAEGCSTTIKDSAYIVTHPLPIAEFNYTPEEPTAFNPEITFIDQSSSDVSNWFWNFGDYKSGDDKNYSSLQNSVHLYADTGSYCITLKVNTQYGCIDTIQKCLRIKPEWVVFIPNAFTPNIDNKNEVFKPVAIGIEKTKDYEFLVFDRWGNLFFRSEDYDKGWDGKNSGDDVQQDVYVYKLKVLDVFGKHHQYTGTVALIR